MAGIHTPFAAAHHGYRRNSYDGTSPSKEPSNNAARQLSHGFTLDDSFNLPSCPSLDEFLLHATQGFMDSTAANAAAAQGGGGHGSGALPRIPSRLLTMSTGKSLSAMASLDLGWLADGPFGAQQQAQQQVGGRPALSIQRKPSLAEQLVGPEQLGPKELPSVPPLNIESGFKRPASASGSLPPPKKSATATDTSSQQQPQRPLSASAAASDLSSVAVAGSTGAPPPSVAAETATYQLHAAHTALLEAQTNYLKVLEINSDSSKTPPSLAQYEQIAAAQQHLAMQQSYFGAALMHAQQFSSHPPQQQQASTTLGGFAGNTPPMQGGYNQSYGLVPLGTNGVPSSSSFNQQHYSNNINLTSSGFLSSSTLAPKTPSQTRANAMAQWEQERALMQALNSSDMETSVQAFSGILNVAGGGGGIGGGDDVLFGTGGPCGVPQNLPTTSASPPPHSSFDHSMYGAGCGSTFPSSVTTGAGDGSRRSATPPMCPMSLKISSGVQPMVRVTHAQPIKVSCSHSSAPSSPMRVEQNQ
ncbi:hypothetical protein NADE_007931 [Nannochloris sp. 'desiccata']|nr:hypothetical protein KSW81_003312 [Chlorella desiccata (nom. nud.)]KAH7623067.1 hypothetical protein NADE_007931 [Chlorella desiccata (nom. nud.)]